MKHVYVLVIFLLCFTASFCQNLHVFLFCNTNDKKIGESAKKNLFHFNELAERVSKSIGYNLVPYYLFGERFNKLLIENTIRDASFKPGDIAFIYLSTHGANRKEDHVNFPVIQVSDVFMSSFGIYKEIAKKNPKALISIVEACNGYKVIDDAQIRFLYRQSIDYAAAANVPPSEVKIKNIKALFTNGCRFIVCAGKPGQDTWATSIGSIFSNNFLRAFDEGISDLKNAPSWATILKASHTYTYDETLGTPLPHYPIWSKPKCISMISQSIDDDSTEVFVEEPIIDNKLVITSSGPKRKHFFGSKTYYDFTLSLKENNDVDSVTYFLHHTFKDSIVTVYNKPTQFRYKLINVFGDFPIKAIIHYSNGRKSEDFDEIRLPVAIEDRRLKG